MEYFRFIEAIIFLQGGIFCFAKKMILLLYVKKIIQSKGPLVEVDIINSSFKIIGKEWYYSEERDIRCYANMKLSTLDVSFNLVESVTLSFAVEKRVCFTNVIDVWENMKYADRSIVFPGLSFWLLKRGLTNAVIAIWEMWELFSLLVISAKHVYQ